MNLCMQYHSYGKTLEDGSVQGLPFSENPFGDSMGGIHTSRKHIEKEVGSQVFLIVGIGVPKRFFLWETFRIEEVESAGDSQYYAHGLGWQLNPPAELHGAKFKDFQRQCANFVSFNNVTNLKFSQHLRELADKHHIVEDVTDETIQFCNQLVSLISDDGESYFLRGVAHQIRGLKNDNVKQCQLALYDFDTALEFGSLDEAATLHWRGSVFRTLGDNSSAISDFQRALTLCEAEGLVDDAEVMREEIAALSKGP